MLLKNVSYNSITTNYWLKKAGRLTFVIIAYSTTHVIKVKCTFSFIGTFYIFPKFLPRAILLYYIKEYTMMCIGRLYLISVVHNSPKNDY